jgi:hypothetical protein
MLGTFPAAPVIPDITLARRIEGDCLGLGDRRDIHLVERVLRPIWEHKNPTPHARARALGARWDEMDLAAREWTLPAKRIKGGVKHCVPLNTRAVAIIEEMLAIKRSEFVFPGTRRGKGLGHMTFQVLLRRMGCDGVTVHGFRSSFRDWCMEIDKVREVVAEARIGPRHKGSNGKSLASCHVSRRAYRAYAALSHILRWSRHERQSGFDPITEQRPQAATS